MATSLLDIVKQNMQQAANPQQQPVSNTQEAVRLMRAQSGKLVGPTQSAVSSVAEGQQQAQTAGQLQGLQQQAQFGAAQLQQQSDQQKAQEQLARADIGLAQRAQTQAFGQALQSQNQQAGQQAAELDMDKLTAQAQQRAQDRALSNKQYLDTLSREGSRRRLDNELEFKRALQRSALGQKEELVRKMLGNQEMIAMDDREFKRATAAMSNDLARQIADQVMADQAAAGRWEAAGGATSAAIGAYGKYQENKSQAASEKRTAQADRSNAYDYNQSSSTTGNLS